MIFSNGNIIVDLVILSVTLITFGIFYVKWRYSYWSRRGIVAPKPSFPFGNAGDVFARKAAVGASMMKTYNDFKSIGFKYLGYYLGMQRTFLFFDPELIKTIMTKDFAHFTDHGHYVNEQNDPLTGHLFLLKGQKWRNMRVKLTPTFTSGKMKMMFPTLLDCSKELITIMDKVAEMGEEIEIKDVVARYTTDIIGSCAFGVDCNSLKDPNSEFRYYGKKVFVADKIVFLKRFIAGSFPWIMDIFKIPLMKRDVTEFFLNVVKQMVDYRETNNVIRKDFMHLLIQLKNNVQLSDDGNLETLDKKSGNEEGLTINQIAAQAFVFFIAGFETSSTTLTFCFYELVSNPDIQEKLRKEIDEVLARHDGKLTYEALSEMTYMEKCVDETLRKYPPLPILMRQCTETYKVPESDVVIEKGIRVFVPILGIQRDPEYYPDPEKFDPERFSRENKAKRHPFTWLPFGEGPRICIGLRFGMMQTKVALAILLKRYKFSLNSKTQTPLVMDPSSIILNTKGGIWLNAEKIADN